MSNVTPRGRVAAVQMVSGPTVDANLEKAQALLTAASAAGADLAVLPENFACMPARETDRIQIAEEDDDGVIQGFLADTARTLGMWIVGGTIPIRCPRDPRPAAACLVYDGRGQRRARYDKIHLFDVNIPGSEESYRESESILPGGQPVVVDSPLGRLGLAVCYDLRFPELFRSMLDRGLDVIVLPAAFTARTGRAHWETLLRARAIENQCYVVAAAQGGRHAGGRETWGESMIIDPWGTVLEHKPEGPGLVLADMDLGIQREIRRRFPALAHRHGGATKWSSGS